MTTSAIIPGIISTIITALAYYFGKLSGLRAAKIACDERLEEMDAEQKRFEVEVNERLRQAAFSTGDLKNIAEWISTHYDVENGPPTAEYMEILLTLAATTIKGKRKA